MPGRKIILSLSVFCLSGVALLAQTATVNGTIHNRLDEEPVEFATVFVDGTQNAVESDENGRFELQVPAGREFKLVITRIGFKQTMLEVGPLKQGEMKSLAIGLALADSDLEVIVRESEPEKRGMIRENVEELKLIPTTTGNLESILPHIALGTSAGTGGELSSQYNVRGGNYDENLVYVNDFEIYRPQLIRSSQQEGLSFPNTDLTRDLSFSSGGFEAKYGDKLSSVLDIHYKRPDSLMGSVSASALGASGHIEGSVASKQSSYRHFRYLAGVRYKTTKYLLSTLDVEGEYTPSFFDGQMYLSYDLSRELQLGAIGNVNTSIYDFVPVSRETAQGLIDFALKLTSEFEGLEVDDFITGMGGLSLTWLPDKRRNPMFLKFLVSGYRSLEKERFDILGAYRLSQIETNIGDDDAGEEIQVLGTGIQHGYTRNLLYARVYNAGIKGGIEYQLPQDEGKEKTHFVEWSARVQSEDIFDKINEWERLDSAGYSLPYDTASVQLQSVLKTRNTLESIRLSASIQDSYTRIGSDGSEIRLTAGVRYSYWDLNCESLVSPRAQALYKPAANKGSHSFRLASGLYHQPPFYREMRRRDGTVNTDLKAQKSFHVLGGWTYDFGEEIEGRRKFRLISELYYKKLWDLVSYDVENVRIRYSGENDAAGYVAGLDVRLNGEFVPGAESWFNLSVLRAREHIVGVQHLQREIGDTAATAVNNVPRPTDQLVNLNIFFQDYLPKNDNFKVHLNFAFGTGLPFGLKDNNIVYRNTYRYNPYHRVDIGFSAQLWDREWKEHKPHHFLRFTRSAWLSLEIFNLMQVRNEASKTWIKTIYNTQYAISNYLTSRRVNLRLRVEL